MLTVPAITAVLVLVALSALANDAAPPSGSRHRKAFCVSMQDEGTSS